VQVKVVVVLLLSLLQASVVKQAVVFVDVLGPKHRHRKL